MSKPIRIPVKLDTNEAKKDLGIFNRSLGDTFGAIKGMSVGAASAIAAVGAGLKVLADLTKESIKLASNQQVQEQKLETALSLKTQSYRSIAKELVAYNNTLQYSTNIDADSLTQLQHKLTLMGVQAHRLKEATDATIGLSNVTGNLDSASKLVARTLAGNTSGLERYGITAKNSEQALSRLIQMKELSSQAVATFDGRLKAINNTKEDFLKIIGRSITDNTELNQALVKVNQTAIGLTPEIHKLAESVGVLTSFLGDTISAGIDVIKWGVDFHKTLEPAYSFLANKLIPGYANMTYVLGLITSSYKAANAEQKRFMETAGGLNKFFPTFKFTPDKKPEAKGGDKKGPAPKTFNDLAEGALGRAASAQSDLNAGKAEDMRLEQEHQDKLMAGLVLQEQGLILAQQIDQGKQEIHLRNLARIDEIMDRERAANTNQKSLWENAFAEGSAFMESLEYVALNVSDVVGSVADAVIGGIGQMFSGLAVTIGNALSGLETNTAAILGGFLSMVGQTMIALGTILIASAIINPASLAPGLALLGGGIAAVALGTVISNSGRSSAPARATSSAGGGPRPGSANNGGFFNQDPFNQGGPSETHTTIIIQGNAPLAFVGASEEEAGRTLKGMLGKADSLEGRTGRWGG